MHNGASGVQDCGVCYSPGGFLTSCGPHSGTFLFATHHNSLELFISQSASLEGGRGAARGLWSLSLLPALSLMNTFIVNIFDGHNLTSSKLVE